MSSLTLSPILESRGQLKIIFFGSAAVSFLASRAYLRLTSMRSLTTTLAAPKMRQTWIGFCLALAHAHAHAHALTNTHRNPRCQFPAARPPCLAPPTMWLLSGTNVQVNDVPMDLVQDDRNDRGGCYDTDRGGQRSQPGCNQAVLESLLTNINSISESSSFGNYGSRLGAKLQVRLLCYSFSLLTRGSQGGFLVQIGLERVQASASFPGTRLACYISMLSLQQSIYRFLFCGRSHDSHSLARRWIG